MEEAVVNKVQRVLTGGLVVVNPVDDNPKELRDIRQRLQSSTDRDDQVIRDFLRTMPQKLDEYTNFFEIATLLRWNASEEEATLNQLRDCSLSYLEPNNNVYRCTLDSRETRDINPGASVQLTPKSDSQIFNATVVAVDRRAGFIDISPESSASISTETTYDICILPSSFLFKSHLRSIRLLCEKQMEDRIYPSLLTENVVSLYIVDATIGNAIKDTLNAMQRNAVMEILSGRHGSTPYLLFGPPGTGKTTTVVEAVRLLLRASPSNRILLCAPSNVAADLLAVELLRNHTIDRLRMRRLYSIYRPLSEIHPLLKDVVTVVEGSGEKSFGFEAREKLLQYRVLVCTLGASTYLVDGGLDGSFSHVIIDEAGQATEVDCLIPLAGLATGRTRVILAGDPKQLGPVITEDFLKDTFYGNSMLARLMERSCYASDNRLMCQLVENYRSHECILRVPSDAFYGGTLVPKASHDRYSLGHWARLPKKNFPLMWIDVLGTEELAGQDGCSYCNEDEITALLNIILNLLEETDVEPKDIGIITPYKLQVRKLHEVLKRIPEITIDSVERYQGSERRVILMSTVRTDGLGFLACDKRLNTAITRAKHLLVVVGSARNLSRHSSWSRFIHYCQQNGALVDASGARITESFGKGRLRIVQKQSANDRNSTEEVTTNGQLVIKKKTHNPVGTSCEQFPSPLRQLPTSSVSSTAGRFVSTQVSHAVPLTPSAERSLDQILSDYAVRLKEFHIDGF